MQISPSYRYVLFLAISLLICFGAIWAYVVHQPMRFMESGYPIWVAKQGFISRCDLGTSIISGDSRAEAAIDPRGLDVPTRNITFGGETPLEGYFFIRKAMECPAPPKQIVLSYGISDFTWVSEFLWENGARFGFVGYPELEDISSTARSLGDDSVEDVEGRLGFGGRLRNSLYSIQFPPLYFNALVTGQIFRRYDTNLAALSNAREQLGHIPYRRAGAAAPAAAQHLSADFSPLPVQKAFFERTVQLLEKRKVEALYISMPVSQAEARRWTPGSRQKFEEFLSDFSKRHANFRFIKPLMVVWPDEAFVDGVHLEASFVARFTELFRACQKKVRQMSGASITCDLNLSDATNGAGAGPNDLQVDETMSDSLTVVHGVRR
jgi:hypothetical protein